MKNRSSRAAIGLPQIMATLLVVLPTLVFAIVILLDYWSVMQADYKLKLVANIVSEYAIASEDLNNIKTGNILDQQARLDSMVARANSLCPKGTSTAFSNIADATGFAEVDIEARYTYNGTYIKNKTLTTQMNAYSYVDQNISVVVTCQ